MDDALGVRCAHCIGNLDPPIDHPFHSQSLPLDYVSEGLSFEQFHGYESSTIGLVDFVDGADVGVVQRGRSFGFALETAEDLRIVG
jgi:hypothetical protein